TNPGKMGTGGTVGVDGLTLIQLDKPEIEIFNNRSLSGSSVGSGLTVQANNVTIRGLSIWGFGNSANDANIMLLNPAFGAGAGGGTGTLIENNVIGASATSFTDPGAITGFTVTNGGTGYSTPPTVIFSGGGGYGATGSATVVNGAVTAV